MPSGPAITQIPVFAQCRGPFGVIEAPGRSAASLLGDSTRSASGPQCSTPQRLRSA